MSRDFSLKPFELTLYLLDRKTHEEIVRSSRHDEAKGAFKTLARLSGKWAYQIKRFEIRNLGVLVFKGEGT